MNKLSLLLLACSILLLLAAVSMFIVASELAMFNFTILVIGVFLFAIFSYINRNRMRNVLHSRLLKALVREATTIALVLGIVGLLNYLVFKNNHKFDLTRDKIHSLSSQTRNVLKHFSEGDFEFTLFAKREDWERYLKLLNMYSSEQSNLNISAVDVDSEPALLAMNDIKENGTLLIKYHGKKYRTILKDELSLTNMLLKIKRPDDINLFVSVGHNEASLSDQSPGGMSYLSEVLTNSNFKLREHNLSKALPKNADALLLLKPELSFSTLDIANLKNHIEEGGSLIVTMAPRFDEISLKKLESFFQELGVTFVNSIVLDRLSSTQGGQASVPMINKYPEDNPIVNQFTGRTLFPVSSFFKIDSNSTYDWKPLIETAHFPATWGETNFSEVKSGKASYNEGVDFKGPLTLAVSGENEVGGKVILFSTTAFLSNQFQGQANNFNLFLNTLSWAVEEESIISLDRPELRGNLVYISDIHFNFVFYFTVLFFPFIFFGIGIYLYKRKLSL